MEAASLDPSQFHLLRGPEKIGADDVDYRSLLKSYKLDAHHRAMATAALPSTYLHLLRGVGENPSCVARGVQGDLLSLLQGVPFDRPIETFPDTVVKAALQLPAASKLGPAMQHMKKTSGGLIHAPPSTAGEKLQAEDRLKRKAKDDIDKREKKEKKKEKRKREDGEMLQKVLAPLVAELRALTWAGWVVSGKPGNPFIQKITKDNCRRLGVPNYFDFVAEPMDLTRMKERNDRAEYTRVDQFTADLKLMVANAKTFNRVGEPVHSMAVEIEQLYEAKAATYAAAFEDLQSERKKKKKEKKKKKDKKKEAK